MQSVMLLIVAASGCAALSADDSIPRITYNFIYDVKTWTEARIHCRDHYTSLMTVESMEDVNKLNALANPNKLMSLTNSHVAWIGMQNDWNQWTWSYQDPNFYQGDQIKYRRWTAGEPNLAEGKEQCAEMYSSGEWNDVPCGWTRSFACMKVTGQDVTFHHYLLPKTWTEARSYCRQQYTDLASVRHLTDSNNIGQSSLLWMSVWLGLYRSGWRYWNGTFPKFSYWRDGQPNPYQQDCAAANFGNQGRWEDSNCNNLRASICYHVVPISKKVVRLRLERNVTAGLITPDDLDQLLIAFKQKLRDRGVTGGLTLSWRTRAGGGILHPERNQS